MDAEQCAFHCHASRIYAGCRAVLPRIAHISIEPSRSPAAMQLCSDIARPRSVASLCVPPVFLGLHEKTISAPLRLHLETCAAPGTAGTLAVRENEISKETDNRLRALTAYATNLLPRWHTGTANIPAQRGMGQRFTEVNREFPREIKRESSLEIHSRSRVRLFVRAH
jgi:hypothetical protein